MMIFPYKRQAYVQAIHRKDENGIAEHLFFEFVHNTSKDSTDDDSKAKAM